MPKKQIVKVIIVIAITVAMSFIQVSSTWAVSMGMCELDLMDDAIPLGGTITGKTSSPCVAIANTRIQETDEYDLFHGIGPENTFYSEYERGSCSLSKILTTLSKAKEDGYNWSNGCVVQTLDSEGLDKHFIPQGNTGRARSILFQGNGMPATKGEIGPLFKSTDSVAQVIKTPIEINTANIHMATIIGGPIPLWKDTSVLMRKEVQIEKACRKMAEDQDKSGDEKFMEACVKHWGGLFTPEDGGWSNFQGTCLGKGIHCKNYSKTDSLYANDHMTMNWEKHLIAGDGRCLMDDEEGTPGIWCLSNFMLFEANTLVDINSNNTYLGVKQRVEDGYDEPYYHVIHVKDNGVLRITGNHPVIFRNVKIKCEIDGGNCLEIEDGAKVIFENSAVEVFDHRRMPDAMIKAHDKENLDYLGTNHFILRQDGLKKVFDFENTDELLVDDLKNLRFKLGDKVSTIPLMSDDPVTCSNATDVVCTLPKKFHGKVLKINPAGKVIKDVYLTIDGKDYLSRYSLAIMTTSGRPIIFEDCNEIAHVANGSFNDLECRVNCNDGYLLSQNGRTCELECAAGQHDEDGVCVYDDDIEEDNCPGEATYDGTNCICSRASLEAVWDESNNVFECMRKCTSNKMTGERDPESLECLCEDGYILKSNKCKIGTDSLENESETENDYDSQNEEDEIEGSLFSDFNETDDNTNNNGSTDFDDDTNEVVSGCSIIKTAPSSNKEVEILIIFSVFIIIVLACKRYDLKH